MEDPQPDPAQLLNNRYCAYLISDADDPLNTAKSAPWYRRTQAGRAFGKFVALTSPFYLVFTFCVLMGISGQILSYVMPSMYNEGTTCNNNLFTLNATFSDWFCNNVQGTVAWIFFALIALYISLMFSPLYWWLRLNKNYRVMWGIAICLLPFYVFGLELFGVMAAKITNNYDLIELCNLDSYNDFMNVSCLKYGAITLAIILGIELGVAMLIAGCLTLREYLAHDGHDLVETHPKETITTISTNNHTVELEVDPQLTTGDLKN
jgi:hypothetical protein